MENFTMTDGLILTVVSMIVVFILLAAIWGLVELVAYIINQTPLEDATFEDQTDITNNILVPSRKNQLVAELISLALASENQPNKKFEIVESKRMK